MNDPTVTRGDPAGRIWFVRPDAENGPLPGDVQPFEWGCITIDDGALVHGDSCSYEDAAESMAYMAEAIEREAQAALDAMYDRWGDA